MSTVVLILGLALTMYALRSAGLLLADAPIPAACERALAFVPAATLSALVTASVTTRSDDGPVRLLAVAGAGLVAWRYRRMWLCIASGMAIYWLLTLLSRM